MQTKMQKSIPDDRTLQEPNRFGRIRGEACTASHPRTQQRPTGINGSQEENAQRWEMSTA